MYFVFQGIIGYLAAQVNSFKNNVGLSDQYFLPPIKLYTIKLLYCFNNSAIYYHGKTTVVGSDCWHCWTVRQEINTDKLYVGSGDDFQEKIQASSPDCTLSG